MEEKHDEETQEQIKRAKLETSATEEPTTTSRCEPVVLSDVGPTVASSGSQGGSSNNAENENKRSEKARSAATKRTKMEGLPKRVSVGTALKGAMEGKIEDRTRKSAKSESEPQKRRSDEK